MVANNHQITHIVRPVDGASSIRHDQGFYPQQLEDTHRESDLKVPESDVTVNKIHVTPGKLFYQRRLHCIFAKLLQFNKSKGAYSFRFNNFVQCSFRTGKVW